MPKPVSNAPSYSCRLWHDREGVYVELASGLITRFDKTEGALSKVLKLLEREAKHYQSPLTRNKSQEILPLKPKASKKPKPIVSDDETNRALEALRRKGRL